MNHTPGPWQVCKSDFRAVEGPDGQIIADIRAPARENGREDARLIAGAPDLLAALERAIPEIAAVGIPDLLEQARAAIKKARGE